MTFFKRICDDTKTKTAIALLAGTLSFAPLTSRNCHAQEKPVCSEERWDKANSINTWKEAEVVANALVSYLEKKKVERASSGLSTDEATFGVFPKRVKNNDECDQGTILLKALIHFLQMQGKISCL